MSRRQVGLLLLLSLILGLAAVFIAKQWLDGKKQQKAVVEEVERVPVLISTMDLEPGTILEDKHIESKLMEISWVNEQTLTEETLNEGSVVAATIYAGEMIHRSRLAQPGEGATLAALISENKRAITIRVNDVIGVAGFLLPGNKVDILNTTLTHQGKQAVTKTILTNIKVLAVDQTAKTNDNKPVIVRAVTLEVSPQQAKKLLSANSKGNIQLALRNPHEIDQPTSISKPVSRPKVTIIKGTNVSSIRVRD